MAKQKPKQIIITPPKLARVIVEIEGISSLICHQRTSEGIQKKPTPEKDPEVQFQQSLYPKINGKYAFPASAIKKAVIAAAKTYCTSINKNQVTGSFYINQDWLLIEGDEPRHFKHIVLVPPRTGSPVEHTRAEFPHWKMKIPLEYDENGPIGLEILVNLISSAGFHIGIGVWRPEKQGGPHGRFRVVSVKSIGKKR